MAALPLHQVLSLFAPYFDANSLHPGAMRRLKHKLYFLGLRPVLDLGDSRLAGVHATIDPVNVHVRIRSLVSSTISLGKHRLDAVRHY